MSAPSPSELIALVSNWGRWGEHDELGTANLITPAKRLEGAACVRTGVAVSLAADFEPETPQFKPSYRLNPQRSMVDTGTDVRAGRQAAFGIPGHGFADDMVVMSLQASTHWDALAHAFHDYRMYNGRPCELVGGKGAAANDIAVVRDRLVTRGVLADVAGHLGVEALEPGHHVAVAELEATLAAQDVDVRSGDALLIRTGQLGLVRRTGAWDRFVDQNEPGLGWDALPWLRERDVAAVAADNWAFEAIPSGYDLPMPVHAIGIVYMGLLVGEIFELDELAAACRAQGDWDFLLAAPPLPFLGAVGSPANPVAVL